MSKPRAAVPKVTTALAIKLGSIAVHLGEYVSPRGHVFDRVAAETLLADPEVKRWLKAMLALRLLPVTR